MEEDLRHGAPLRKQSSRRRGQQKLGSNYHGTATRDHIRKPWLLRESGGNYAGTGACRFGTIFWGIAVATRARSSTPRDPSQLHSSKRRVCESESLSRQPARYIREYILAMRSRSIIRWTLALQPVDALRLPEHFPARNACYLRPCLPVLARQTGPFHSYTRSAWDRDRSLDENDSEVVQMLGDGFSSLYMVNSQKVPACIRTRLDGNSGLYQRSLHVSGAFVKRK